MIRMFVRQLIENVHSLRCFWGLHTRVLVWIPASILLAFVLAHYDTTVD